MFDKDLWRRLHAELKNLFPLFRYLVLQTETHAFCLALAAASLLALYPACLVMLAIFRNTFKWDSAYDAVLNTVQTYVPVDPPDFISRNLAVSARLMGRRTQLGSWLWILLGTAGVFIPLETGLNRLWNVQNDRPYWMNQLVGFTLTLVCAALGLLFLSISGGLHFIINHYLVFATLQKVTRFIVIHVTTTCLFVTTTFVLYKFLPNTKISAHQVLPAAILAGVMAEVVRIVFAHALPALKPTQGIFAASVSVLLLVYFESFVILGCAFLASQSERYPWMGFLKRKRSEASS